MKVIQVCPKFWPYLGGVITHVRELSNQLIKLGVDVEIYTTDPLGRLPKEDVIDGIKISRFKSYSLNDLYFFSPTLYIALKKVKNADIIHAHNYQDYCVLASVQAKRKNQIPLVITPHYHPSGSNEWRTIAKELYHSIIGKYALRQSEKIIAVSRYERHLLIEKFLLNPRKVAYIPNGINSEKCKLRMYMAFKKRFKEGKIILYVGRLEKYKGVQFLIRALPNVIARVQDSKLLVVGEGKYKDSLVSLAKRLGISNKVYFLGNVSESELIRLYLTSDIFVMPSKYEAFCIALAEAMAFGLPVVATKVGGIPELIGNNRGFLIEYPPNEKKLAEIITFVLENSKIRTRLSYKARNFILSKFSWEAVAKNHINIYKELA